MNTITANDIPSQGLSAEDKAFGTFLYSIVTTFGATLSTVATAIAAKGNLTWGEAAAGMTIGIVITAKGIFLLSRGGR